LKEFELIKQIKDIFPQKNIAIGIGDDTAAIKKENGYMLITVDTITTNTHYRKKWRKKAENLYFSLGWKLLAISISDIVSMGGVPELATVSFCLEKNFSKDDIFELSKGLAESAKHYNINIAGGDTVKGDCEVFSLTLIGYGNSLMLRNNAKPGDFIAVTGFCGNAAGGLHLLEKKALYYSEIEKTLIENFLFPSPDIPTGKLLLENGVKCCIDNSDGLLVSLSIIAEESDVAINIEKDKIPISKKLKKVFGEDSFNLAISGGEDYNLIFTFPEKAKEKFEKIDSVSIIGKVENGEGVYLDGKEITPSGFDHFGGNYDNL